MKDTLFEINHDGDVAIRFYTDGTADFENGYTPVSGAKEFFDFLSFHTIVPLTNADDLTSTLIDILAEMWEPGNDAHDPIPYTRQKIVKSICRLFQIEPTDHYIQRFLIAHGRMPDRY